MQKINQKDYEVIIIITKLTSVSKLGYNKNYFPLEIRKFTYNKKRNFPSEIRNFTYSKSEMYIIFLINKAAIRKYRFFSLYIILNTVYSYLEMTTENVERIILANIFVICQYALGMKHFSYILTKKTVFTFQPDVLVGL